MKKIMFNTRYGLEQAVLEGRKTMTRRLINVDIDSTLIDSTSRVHYIDDLIKVVSRYQVGEVVAIAQSYRCVGCDFYFHRGLAGWNNKMFVRAEEMPHHIRITNIRVERLQDISEENCLREGIEESKQGNAYYVQENGEIKATFGFPSFAFQYLIDKVSSKGTWKKNPYVFVYEFEKVD